MSEHESAEIQRHAAECARCGKELSELSALSRWLEPARDGAWEPTLEIARLHAAAQREIDARPSVSRPDRNFWRTAGLISGLAASVLIVASAWLWETPGGSARPSPGIAAAPEWEQVATRLQVDPLPDLSPGAVQDQSALAMRDAKLANWMLENLNFRSAHEAP